MKWKAANMDPLLSSKKDFSGIYFKNMEMDGR